MELCRATEGTHFVVVIRSEKGDGIAVPLSQQLTNQLEVMLLVEGISTMVLPVTERSR
jgi:hypothetical protein